MLESGRVLLDTDTFNFLGAANGAESGMGGISVSAGTTVLDTGWVCIAAAGGLFFFVLSR
jgi:hypothetical protein